jgi:hypothetical protein
VLDDTTCDRRWRSCADRSGVRLLCPLGSTPPRDLGILLRGSVFCFCCGRGHEEVQEPAEEFVNNSPAEASQLPERGERAGRCPTSQPKSVERVHPRMVRKGSSDGGALCVTRGSDTPYPCCQVAKSVFAWVRK